MKRSVVAVIGLGYVGLATGLSLTIAGYKVIGVDVSEEIVERLNAGRVHLDEPGMEEALRRALERGLFVATTSYKEASEAADIFFIAVGTPSRDDGSIDLSFIEKAATSLARELKGRPDKLVVIRSTVIPGTTRRIAGLIESESGLRLGETLSVAYNPEFLREGYALEDVLRPGRVIIGEIDRPGARRLLQLWSEFYDTIGERPSLLLMPAETAEMVKYANNTFLSTKISFINEIAKICEMTPNCDVSEVARAIGLDPRICPQYLGAGLGYGGSCLPKDTRALIKYSESLGIEPHLLSAVDRVNVEQVEWVVRRVSLAAGGLAGRTVAVLGVSFKAGSCDTRESRSLALIKRLRGEGARVVVFDPCIRKGFIDCSRLPECDRVEIATNLESAIIKSDIIIIATEWKEFKKIAIFRDSLTGKIVYDARRLLTREELEDLDRAGARVLAIGLGRGRVE